MSNNIQSSDNLQSRWSMGSYKDFAIFILPVSAHLVKICKISANNNVLDVACGTGNTAITAKKTGANVTGVDFTPELLNQAKEEAALADVGQIEWKEANVESLPFNDESFDTVLSSFGHIFATQPQKAIDEMLRVTKKGGTIGFATWPPELINGKLFEVMTKHVPTPATPTTATSESTVSLNPIPSPMQWGDPQIIKQRLGNSVSNIHFERGVAYIPILSLNHYWKMTSTKFGTVIQAIKAINDPAKVEHLKHDLLNAIEPYISNNSLKLDYLITKATKTD